MLLDHPSLRRATLLAAGAAGLVLAAACSGQITSPTGAGGAPDTTSSVSGFNTPCDGCTQVCTGNACVQCVQDDDCAASGNASLTCQDNMCVCLDDAQCANDVNGAVCMSGTCGCNTAGDCVAGIPACPKAGGVCGCVASAQCTNPSLGVCEVATAQCISCSDDADCAGSPGGSTCTIDGACSCADDTECAGSPRGPHCITSECGCQENADCGSSAYGAVCSQGTCTCASNADCPTGGTCSGTLPSGAAICE